MGRRHFGSVRKLPSGRWQARYEVEGRHYAAPGTFRTKADALGHLSDIEASIRRGVWVDPAAGRVTLADYATHWLAARSDLRPTTRGKYGHLLRAHVLPALGDLPLASLAPSQVRAWYHDLAQRHQTTADDAYQMLPAISTPRWPMGRWDARPAW